MTLRTPRRRISPRTKRRYRAIREFFRRAIGSSSHPDIKNNSSIALNVTDLNRKILGLEEQLDQVSKHCQDVVRLQNHSRSEILYPSDVNHNIRIIKEQTEPSSDRKSNGEETKVLYKTSDCNYRRSDESDCEQKHNNSHHVDVSDMMNGEFDGRVKVNKDRKKLEKVNEYSSKLHKHKTHSAYENFSTAYSTSSFHSLANPRHSHSHSHADYSGQHNERKHYKSQYRSISPNQLKDKKRKDHMKRNNMENCTIYEDKPVKSRKHKHENRKLDHDFISDIIRRQYQPVKMFGKRESDISQFSAPVCRDQEYSLHENIQEGSELCSCCYEGKNMTHRRNDMSDMRSICDTRLYSSKKHPRTHHRRVIDVYNNSELYDLIPVKEKTSPKSRRKFVEDNIMPYGYYREVPPSPRTLRPRLNLKSQYFSEFNDYMVRKPRRSSPGRPRRHQEHVEALESDMTADVIHERNSRQTRGQHRPVKIQEQQQQMQNTGTMSSLQYPAYVNEQTHVMVDTSLDKTQETNLSVDKTDKALIEIKDILQSFLQEIKKDTSQSDKSDSASKTGENDISILQQNSAKTQCSVLPKSGHSFNNYGAGQCVIPPCMPPFANPCCYPVMCPMNCMQGGFVMPTPSFTCANCVTASKEPSRDDSQCTKSKNTTNESINTETEELIKEIYKYVAQGPVRKSDGDNRDRKKGDTKILTSRSVGDSHRACKHDAKVGTPKLKYSSKSCEAIGSNFVSDTYYSTTNQSYSDTILERLSLEVTQSDTDVSTESIELEKGKGNKFSKVLRSFGLFKNKKKKDVIEELSESESAVDVEIKPKPKPPFRQEVTNYAMYGQEYYNPPPMPRPSYQQPTEYHPDYHPPYNTGVPDYPPPPVHDLYTNKQQPIPERGRGPFRSPQRPTAPPYSPYDNRYNPQQNQVPLCLKEIEVKSIATQSERKMSLFRKIKRKIQPPVQSPMKDPQRNFATQTAVENKPTWFKNLQTKAMQDKLDPMNYSLKTQKQLAEGDIKMRNAMLKKLFHKRNPFSPRNMIVKTLLGKDRASYGEPQGSAFRPRIFF